jgi:AcrR family transcriptional regulator
MAYEVTKIVKGHRYRYRVESVRDEATGRSRARWTYLGRVGDDDVIVPRRHASSGNVERIVSAIVRLLEKRRIEHVTMTVIAREAGVAPGTIYRHFRSRRDAIMAAVKHVSEAVFEAAGPLDSPLGSREEERLRLGSWVRRMLEAGINSPALVQAIPALDTLGEREERRDPVRAVLSDYLGRLIAAGHTNGGDIARLTSAMFLAMEGVFRVALNEGERFPRHLVDDAVYLIDRAVFGP